MPVPQVGNVLNGWTKKQTVEIITKTIVNHKKVESSSSSIQDIGCQPMPAALVNRKVGEQRTWKWWLINIKSSTLLLKTDDKIIVDSITYRIQKASDWRTSGFTKYEAIEDYT